MTLSKRRSPALTILKELTPACPKLWCSRDSSEELTTSENHVNKKKLKKKKKKV